MNLSGLMEGLAWFWVNLLEATKFKSHKHHEYQRGLSDTWVIQGMLCRQPKLFALFYLLIFKYLVANLQSEQVPGTQRLQTHHWFHGAQQAATFASLL